LGLLDRIKRKKKEGKETDTQFEKIKTELDQLCGDDKETYEALFHTMFLDPRKIAISMRDAAENAKKFEKDKDSLRARAWYEIAGGLAIYDGNTKKVVEFFGECEKLSLDRKYSILKNPEKAVAKAQEFYKKHVT